MLGVAPRIRGLLSRGDMLSKYVKMLVIIQCWLLQICRENCETHWCMGWPKNIKHGFFGGARFSMEQLCSGFTCTAWPRQETRSQPGFAGFPLHHAVGQQQTTLSCISKSYLAWSSRDYWVKLNADQLSWWFRQFLLLFSLPCPSWNDGPRISYPLVI